MKQFEPRILGFLCSWGPYASADLAGKSRIQYSPNLRIIRVMCSARIDPMIIFHAFVNEIDGVAVLACHPGDCHYITGNCQAETKMKMAVRILEKVGIATERLCLDWLTPEEGEKFAKLVNDFTIKVRELGPLGKAEGLSKDDIKARLSTALSMVEDTRMRWLVGKEWDLTKVENAYNEKLGQDEFDKLMDKNIADQYMKSRILSLIEKDPHTIPELAKKINVCDKDTFAYIVGLENSGLVALADFKERYPRYIKVGEK